MIITSPVSAPIAWLLDHFWTRRKEFNDAFTNEQIGSLIKYHERSEKNGGALGQDAARIMLGALNLDSRRIGGVSIPKDESCDGTDKDIEKAVPIVVNGLIVRWNVVKTVDINDQVDDAFIKKVKSWSYSRIPVIGRPRNSENRESIPSGDVWEGTKIFGFLHIKVPKHMLPPRNLVANKSPESSLFWLGTKRKRKRCCRTLSVRSGLTSLSASDC